ncbi:MAG: 2,3-bisphosphoglycerate-dependent phosphoglycerate mutase [Bacteroidetes bacterium]|nr:2,3-bisphosphoglycerate-dependent phosphoglycerate mutase [Bacteroidota bacterium]MBS1935285.1 2,3-bisphosphoglycerate-dependent phosphoglycerate mutase [Bacteroidota bacterium]
MPILAIVRHGQSVWNLENKFTGEIDVDLTEKGRKEAYEAGKDLREIKFDYAFTSALKRADETLDIILEEIQQEGIPVIKDKALNERNYGDLQGLNKTAIAEKYGDEQVAIWRRSYAVKPPGGESLEDTAARVIPYYKKNIEPLLQQNKNILIVAHGNSLRALMMYLENISPQAIAEVNLPTGAPRVYTISNDLKVLRIIVYKEVNL